MDIVSSTQTYSILTRVRSYRGISLTCSEDITNSTSAVFKVVEGDVCTALSHATAAVLTLTSCNTHNIACNSGLTMISSKVVIDLDAVTTQELHRAFNLVALMSETSVSIDFLQIHDFNECKSDVHNCDTNAACKNTMGSYNCVCHRGYSDRNPSLPGRMCDAKCGSSNSCQNGGVCSTVDDRPVCKCTEKYTGRSCEVLKKDVEWLWILGITLVLATLIIIPSGVCLCIYLKTHWRKTPHKIPFQALT